jgi:hypothetical protein
MKSPTMIKGDTVPEGYALLSISDGRWANPYQNSKKFKEQLKEGGESSHLLGFLKQLEGKVLQCDCDGNNCHGNALIDTWRDEFKGAYKAIKWSDRIEYAQTLPEPLQIWDDLIISGEPAVVYAATGTGKSVIDECVMFHACHSTWKMPDMGFGLDEPLRGVKIDIEQPHLSQLKYKPIQQLIGECDIMHIPVQADGQKVDLERILSTAKELSEDGYNFVALDSLQRLSIGDLTQKRAAKEMMHFLEELWSYFPQSITDHHTTKMHALKPYDGVAPMSDSHILEDYTQGSLIWCGRAYRDPQVVIFFQKKYKLAQPNFATGEQVLALRKTGWSESSPFPYEVVLPHQSWDYWNSAPDPNEELAIQIKGMAKKDAIEVIKKKRDVEKSRAYKLFDDIQKSYGDE